MSARTEPLSVSAGPNQWTIFSGSVQALKTFSAGALRRRLRVRLGAWGLDMTSPLRIWPAHPAFRSRSARSASTSAWHFPSAPPVDGSAPCAPSSRARPARHGPARRDASSPPAATPRTVRRSRVTASSVCRAEAVDDGAPRRIGERGEGQIEPGIAIVNHVVKYCHSRPELSRATWANCKRLAPWLSVSPAVRSRAPGAACRGKRHAWMIMPRSRRSD